MRAASRLVDLLSTEMPLDERALYRPQAREGKPMSTSAGDVSEDTSPRKSLSSAERMRRYRKRQRRGQRIVRLQIGPAEIEALVARGFLGPGDREDPIAIEYGLSVLIDDALGDS
jgi:hypothetical protein